jgi:hypothetical protein
MTVRRGSAGWLATLLAACDPSSTPPDAGPRLDAPALRDAAGGDVGPDAAAPECEGFVVPGRTPRTRCDDPSAEAPGVLVACEVGSGHQGRWVVDERGLPAYELEIDQRCDPAGSSWTPRPEPLRDPVHLVGNGRGLVAMAHASGGVELYTLDRGHQWVNRIDRWVDPTDPDRPPQIGGGFVYVVGPDGSVRSTRFEDMPIGEALARQTRRFGVGYVETITRWDDLVVAHRVVAPHADARALVSEVTLEHLGVAEATYRVLDLWDVDVHQVALELLTSDVVVRGTTARIDRTRRRRQEALRHEVRWRPELGRIDVRTSADPAALPEGVDDRLDVSELDWFPDDLFHARLDEGPTDGVWMLASELFDGPGRTPPARAAAPSSTEAREVRVEGAEQPVLLALGAPLTIAPGGRATARFAFGLVPHGTTADAAVDELRAREGSIVDDTGAAWRERLVWAAFPGLTSAGAVQRELAWSSYNALANATYDEYRGVRVEGQGGSYKYIHGLDGAFGDLALFADALLFVDPDLARDTLVYCLASQHGLAGDMGPWRFPYASTGVGAYSDVGIYHQRSDAYWLLPSAIARYVWTTRDAAFLEREVPYWPRAAGESGTVLAHATRALDYAVGTLGLGARGLPAMGTNDYADGVLQFADEPYTPTGTSSTFNALFAIDGLPGFADVVRDREPALATRVDALVATQREALLREAWDPSAGRFHRGFLDSGNPLAPDYLFVEPQVLPILAGLVDDARRDALLDLVAERFETPLGAMTTVPLGAAGTPGGVDMPQIGGVWPVASAWVTAAWSRRDVEAGWSSFLRNTLFTHAELYPELWYGVWTGPDSYNGPDHPRAGEADAHAATALTDYPALNVHVHLGPLRALVALLGVSADARGLTVAPRIPGGRWSVSLPRLAIDHAANRVAITVRVASAGPLELRVRCPSGLASGPIAARVDGALVPVAREGELAVVAVDARPDVPIALELRGG